MKAITLTQPWATLVAIGAKRIETRSWSTRYRGPLAIHASKGFPKLVRELCLKNPFASALLDEFPLPLGKVIAVCELVDIRPIDDWIVSHKVLGWDVKGRRFEVTEQERAFGDFAALRFAWLLADVQRLVEPVECLGALRLWECNLVKTL